MVDTMTLVYTIYNNDKVMEEDNNDDQVLYIHCTITELHLTYSKLASHTEVLHTDVHNHALAINFNS